MSDIQINNICDVYNQAKTIAVVGISKDPSKISRVIADFLLEKGFKVVGVNPAINDANGISVYSSLREIPFQIDVVNVFRKPETIIEIMPDVININPKVLWLQLGIVNDKVVKIAKDHGIFTVQDRCIKVEYNSCK